MMTNKKLNNGIELPFIGMGTYPLKGEDMNRAVLSAIKSGFRMFDTAFAYQNEDSLGIALKNAYKCTETSRDQVFIITKIGEKLDRGIPDGHLFYHSSTPKNIFSIVESQIIASLEKLQTNYIDCLLIHWPFPDYLNEIWSAMEFFYRKGILKSIGVSNCCERHLERIMSKAEVVPMVNQIEVSPLNTRKELLRFCKTNDIQIQVYSPLMTMHQPRIIKDTRIQQIALKHNRSLAQVILRWNVECGLIPITKSSHEKRLFENISIEDFRLTVDEVSYIDSLNDNYQCLPASIYCPGY